MTSIINYNPSDFGYHAGTVESTRKTDEVLTARLSNVLANTAKHINGFAALAQGSFAKKENETVDEARTRAANERLEDLANARKIHPDWDKMTVAQLATMNVNPESYQFDKGGDR